MSASPLAPTDASNSRHIAEPRLGSLDRLQPVMLVGSIGLGLSVAKLAPGFADSLLPLVSIGVLVLIYLVMLGVDLGGVSKALSNRKFLGIAVVLNFVVNPLLAWGLSATFLGSEPDLWIGLILFLVTPCIGWYLIFTELAGGDTQLGVSLLGLNVVLQILLLPVYLYLFAGRMISVDLDAIAGSVALFLVAPLALALLTRRWMSRHGRTVESLEQKVPLGYLKTGTLAVVIISMFASQADELFENPGVVIKLLAPITAFFVITFSIAVFAGRTLNLPFDQTALLAFTTTSRNSEASLAIAATAFSSPLVPLAVVIGPVIELPLLVIMVRVLVEVRQRAHSE